MRIVVSVAVLERGRVLVMREEDEPHTGAWVLPQGYPHPGETLVAAASREVMEELGLDVAVQGLVGVYDAFERNAGGPAVHWVTVCYWARLLRDLPPRASPEAIDFAWVEPSALATSAMPQLRDRAEDLVRLLTSRRREARS